MTDVQLKIVDGPDAGREFPVRGALVIGRDPSAGIVLEDSEVSRRHAQVSPGGAGLTIEDLGSTNGTFVNGERIEGQRGLGGGEKLRIGTTVLEVSVPMQATKIGAVVAEEPDPGATKMASVMSPEEAEAAADEASRAEGAEEAVRHGEPEAGDDEPTHVPDPPAAAPPGPPASAGPQSPAAPPPQSPPPAPPSPAPGFAPPPPPPPAGGGPVPPPPPAAAPGAPGAAFGAPAQQAPVPQQGYAQPPAGYQAGPGFQVRGPGEQWALCYLVPFYAIFWYHRLCKEIGEWSQGRIHTNPVTSTLAITLGAMVVVPAIISFAGTLGRIRQCQQMAGLEPRATFWGTVGRMFLVGYGYKWLTEQLNELAVRRPVQ